MVADSSIPDVEDQGSKRTKAGSDTARISASDGDTAEIGLAEKANPTEGGEAGLKPVLMKRKEIRGHYYTSSGKLSEVIRKLNFAGIAVVWLFWTSENNLVQAETDTWLSILVLFTFSLAFDALQYVWKTVAWGFMNWWYTRSGVQLDEGVEVPNGPVNVVTNLFFWSKVLACGIGFGKLGLLFIGQMSQ